MSANPFTAVRRMVEVTMRHAILPFLLLAAAIPASAHPMGNFSVSHYARLTPSAGVLRVTYALDLAEIPTFELNQGGDAKALPELGRKKMTEWVRGLKFVSGGRALPAKIAKTDAVVTEGAGGMPVMRVTAWIIVDVAEGGTVEYLDTNFEGRAGWKELVVGEGSDLSKALAEYPENAGVAPPQDLKASVTVPAALPVAKPAPIVSKAPVAEPEPAPAPSAGGPQDAAPGSVVRGDFLSTLLGRREIPFPMALLGLGAAFLLGATHALSPGHGKTIVAAYLVGARGTLKHAAFLGAMVTFTHTISVFALGLITLFLSQYILPERIVPWLGAISGLAIVMIGFNLFRKRLARLIGIEGGGHGHHHHHGDGNHHHHHPHGDGHHHHGDGHHHHHVPETVTMGSLVALGVSGGLVPCPSALVLLLSAIAIGRTGYGMLLLITFSLGLALVLMAIGAAVLYAKSLVPSMPKVASSKAFQLVPVLSAAVIVCVGLLMTGAALGVFRLPSAS
ncbi:MAG: hypothetical protein SFV18_08010 [Bryobacteraceae bacterium]|nr:hypothetical protein [Bryobacteraceae bacterium]